MPSEARRGGAGGLQEGGLAARIAEIAASHPDKRIELWLEDEARVGNKGRVCHRWWRRGERPPGIRQLGYQWAYIFTAIRPATGEDVTLVLPAVNTAAMQVFLDHVAASRPPDAHLERVWLYLRERFLSLRLFPSTDAIIDACCNAWMRLVAASSRSAPIPGSKRSPHRLGGITCSWTAHSIRSDQERGPSHFDQRRNDGHARRLVKHFANLGYAVEIKPIAAAA